MIGPFTSCGGSQTRLDIVKPIIQKVLVKVPIELLKEIKKVDISLEPIEPKLVWVLPSLERKMASLR